MITVMIVNEKSRDNELIAASIIGGFETPTCIISTCSPKEAEDIFSHRDDIDLFILQINMKGRSGYKLAESVRKRKVYRNTPILFITAQSYSLVGFPQLATYRSYKKHNYISTPICRLDVQGKLGLYLDAILSAEHETPGERVIYLEYDLGNTFLKVSDILFAEIQNKAAAIHTKHESYSIRRTSLEKIAETVDDEMFIRCHKSFALNVKNISALEKSGRRNWLAVFEDRKCCPVSQTYYDKVKETYMINMPR